MRQRGFTYLSLIILVAIIGLVGAASLKVNALLRRAAAEEDLLETGAAFSDALASYAAVTPKGQPPQPPTLQDLLRDPRSPSVRRHLRKIFVDPVTGKAEWGVMYLGDKVGVIGVYSLSNAKPLKIANFDARFLNMENREKISDWKFMTAQQAAMPVQQPRPPNGMPQMSPLANATTTLTVTANDGHAAPPEPVAEAPAPAPAVEEPPAATPEQREAEEAPEEKEEKDEPAAQDPNKRR